MRFAWLRSKDGRDQPPAMSSAGRVSYVAYNLVWWVPVALALLGILSYWAGSLGFLVMSVIRAVVNVYRINVLPVEAAQRFPLRSP